MTNQTINELLTKYGRWIDSGENTPVTLNFSQAKAQLRSIMEDALDEVLGNYSGSDLVLLDSQDRQRQRKAKILEEIFG